MIGTKVATKKIEALRARGVFNPYEFYLDHPYIEYVASAPRSPVPSAWAVRKRDEKLSDQWYAHGAKRFTGRRRDESALGAAQEWASEKFGIKGWARDPWGGYGPADYVATRLRDVMAMPPRRSPR